MAELSEIVSFGDFRPIDQLRRCELWRIADRLRIAYPHDAAKAVMISLLEGNGIDVTKPESGIQWERITGSDEHGRNTAFLAPRHEQHHSARVGADARAALNARIAAEPDETEGSGEVGALKAEKDRLLQLVARLEARLDAKEKPKPRRKNPNAGARLARYRELKKLLAERGIAFAKNAKIDELERLAAG